MKITFLGTSAATSCPLPFCHCSICRQARAIGGHDLRKRSSLLINDDLLIDLGPDLMSSSFMHGVTLTGVRYWLQTHAHSDHFDLTHLITRIPEYGVEDVPPLHLYASEKCMERMSAMLVSESSGTNLFAAKGRERLNLQIHPIEHGQVMTAGRYEVTAFASNHDPDAGSLLYAIQDGYHSIFYGVDTPVLSEDVWVKIRRTEMQFDLVILDHTYGPNLGGVDHLNANQFIEHVERLRAEDLLKKGGRVLATHISHEGNLNHSEFVAYGRRYGYEIAYDGLMIAL